MTFPEDDAPTGACPGQGPHGECLCSGAGPAVSRIASEMLRHYGPSPETRRHFDQARLELLKGLRALLDERIKDIQKGSAGPARGTKVSID